MYGVALFIASPLNIDCFSKSLSTTVNMSRSSVSEKVESLSTCWRLFNPKKKLFLLFHSVFLPIKPLISTALSSFVRVVSF